MNHTYKPFTLGHALVVGLVCFLLFALVSVAWETARGSEPPPPLIQEVRFKSTMPTASPKGEQEPKDGPMCFAALEEQEGATLLGVLLQEPASEGEEAEVTMQMRRCFRGETKDADPFLLLALYRYEEDLGVPAHMRGLLGSILCVESAMRVVAHGTGLPLRGDWLEGYAGAWGAFSLHSWAHDSDKCALTPDGRDDLLASAACYYSRVLVRLESPFVRAMKCKDPYPLAEALVANQSKYAGLGCAARSHHTRELERWRK